MEELKKKLKEEGFKHVYEWQDTADTVYPPHKHQGKVAFYVVDGDIDMNFEDGKISLHTGDRFDVPVGKLHSAQVGPKGCTFVVGEEIEGDT